MSGFSVPNGWALHPHKREILDPPLRMLIPEGAVNLRQGKSETYYYILSVKHLECKSVNITEKIFVFGRACLTIIKGFFYFRCVTPI